MKAIVIIVFCLIFLLTLAAWRLSQTTGAPKISYKLFKASYAINPERWYFREGELRFCEYSSYIFINYSYIDWWRLQFFFSREKKNKNKKEQNQATERVLQAIQRDVEEEINKSKKEIEQANGMMEDLRAPRSSGDTPCQEAPQTSPPQDSRYYIHTDPITKDKYITFTGKDEKTYAVKVPSYLDRSSDKMILNIFEKKEWGDYQ